MGKRDVGVAVVGFGLAGRVFQTGRHCIVGDYLTRRGEPGIRRARTSRADSFRPRLFLADQIGPDYGAIATR